MHDVAHAETLLNSLQPRGIHYGLDAMAWALEQRGHPERRFKSIIVAGTNGKGSTSAMLHQMLRRLGFRTGIYTSPHLADVRERIRVDGLIPRDALARLILAYEAEGILSRLTYYEALTLAAFDWFAESEVEWAVLEVGVGGRLDAVNLAPAEGAVIVSVDFDHKELLGDTIGAIAAEKAGVIKASRPVVTGDLPPEALAVVEAVAAERGALLYRSGVAFTVSSSAKGFYYDGQSGLIVPELGLHGLYQAGNLGCALAALERIVGIDPASAPEALREALRDVRWRGRFEEISRAPLVVVDAAHNPAGARALAEAFRKTYGHRNLTLVFAALADKDHNAMLAILRPLAERIWLTTIPEQPRATAADVLAHDSALAQASTEIVPPQALHAKIASANPDEAFLVTGSIAFVGWFLAGRQSKARTPES